MFNAAGVIKTFSQWQAMGYDTHSMIMNPDFIDTKNFVSRVPLRYGIDLGTVWEDGLSVDAVWGSSDPETEKQNGRGWCN